MLAAASSSTSDDGLSWHWDREASSCSLFQHTPDGEKLSVTRTPGQDETTIALTVRSPNFWKGVYEDGTVTLSNGVAAAAPIRVRSLENRAYEVYGTIKDAEFTEALSASSSITIGQRSFGKFTTSVRDLGSAMTALRSCENARLRDWGVDADAYWALASRPHPTVSLPELFSSEIYPAVAASRSIERNVIAKLQVGADGSVRSCSVPGDYAYPQFVDAVCKVLTSKARFEPARDQSGQPVAAPYVVVVAFRMASY